MSAWTTDALVDGISQGITLDPGIASFVRGLVSLLLMLFLIVFLVELLVLNHMLLFGVLIGQVAIAMRAPPLTARATSPRAVSISSSRQEKKTTSRSSSQP